MDEESQPPAPLRHHEPMRSPELLPGLGSPVLCGRGAQRINHASGAVMPHTAAASPSA